MRVWVSRDEPAETGPLGFQLERHGLTPVWAPVLQRQPLPDAPALPTLGPEDWLVLTSVFTLQCIDLATARIPRVATVGPATAAAAAEAGLRVSLQGDEGAQMLFDELAKRCRQGTVCYPRSALSDQPRGWDGVRIVAPVVYHTCPVAFDRTVQERVDVLSVASPSAVDAVGRTALPLASIGPTTTAAAVRRGMRVWVESPQATFESLAAAIAGAASLE